MNTPLCPDCASRPCAATCPQRQPARPAVRWVKVVWLAGLTRRLATRSLAIMALNAIDNEDPRSLVECLRRIEHDMGVDDETRNLAGGAARAVQEAM